MIPEGFLFSREEGGLLADAVVGEDVVEDLLRGEAKVLAKDEVHGGDGGAKILSH